MIVKGNRKQTVVEPYVKKLWDIILREYIDMYSGSLVNENSDTKEEITDEYRMHVSVAVDYKDTLTFIVLQYHMLGFKVYWQMS